MFFFYETPSKKRPWTLLIPFLPSIWTDYIKGSVKILNSAYGVKVNALYMQGDNKWNNKHKLYKYGSVYIRFLWYGPILIVIV